MKFSEVDENTGYLTMRGLKAGYVRAAEGIAWFVHRANGTFRGTCATVAEAREKIIANLTGAPTGRKAKTVNPEHKAPERAVNLGKLSPVSRKGNSNRKSNGRNLAEKILDNPRS